MVLSNIQDLVTGWVLEFSRGGGPGIFQGAKNHWPGPGNFQGGVLEFSSTPQKIFLTCWGFEVKGPNTSSRAFLITDLLLK